MGWTYRTQFLMLITINKRDAHQSALMGADTVKLCEMQGFPPRLENKQQSRVDANILGFKAEFAVARLLQVDPPTVNVLTDGGVDLWFDNISIDVKTTNKEYGPLVFDNPDKFQADIAVLVGQANKENTLRINGWIDKTSFLSNSTPHDYGYGPRIKMEAEELRPIEQLWKGLMMRRFRND